ncbi:MAG: sterol desaturase family protein [Chitinophagaceae bacterium]|jgi:sterol desaturase/sphingolipid hydroxylase (fatty acid hydroxylase superfamily)
MDKIITYFSDLEKRPLERAGFFIAGMILLWAIEHLVPLIHNHYKKNKLRHAGTNLAFTAIHFVIHTLLAGGIVLIAGYTTTNGWGIVQWTNAGALSTILITCLTLDFFAGWLCHFVEHKISLFWRFHIIHHADNNVDVTTGLRHHPLESVWRGLFFYMGIFAAGAPMYAVLLYQTILVFITGFTHANISLPGWIDKIISFILVSPNMHKVHHHWKQPYTDSNYGAVFSIWDRMLGTYMELDHNKIKYGLDRYYPNEKDEEFVSLMKRPFQKL